MIKTTKKVIVLAAMMVFGAMLAFAQQSNSSKATFAEIETDVDNFLSTTGWTSLELGNVFAYSRFGANIPDGRLDLGAAFNVGGKGEAAEEGGEAGGGLYVGVYYDGSVTGYSAAPAIRRQETLWYNRGADSETSKSLNVRAESKGNPQATYGVLLGLGSGMAVRFMYTDDLLVTNTGTGGGTYTDTWTGSGTPEIQVGFQEGALKKFGVSMPIVYNRIEMTAINGPSALYSTIGLTDDGDPIDNFADLMAASGNYVEPDIYLKLGSGGFVLENNLRFRIYGVPAHKKGGASTMQMGVSSMVTSSQTIGEGGSDQDTFTSIYDSRFFLEDCVMPSYNIYGESGKFVYSVTAMLPVTFGWTGHSLGAKVQDNDLTSEMKGFYKGVEFNMDIAPTVSAGLQFRPLEALNLQAGICAELLSWGVTSMSTSKVEAPDADNESKYVAYDHARGELGQGVSDKSSYAAFSFTYPKLSVAAGFTFDFKQKAALDVLFIKYAVPTAAGMVYKAVGDGLGNSETSVVLSIKL